jgi:hypothetical protein
LMMISKHDDDQTILQCHQRLKGGWSGREGLLRVQVEGKERKGR